MKIARLLLAVMSISLAAACTADVTAPNPQIHNSAAADSSSSTNWQGGTGSGA